jgi:hypothetical protein
VPANWDVTTPQQFGFAGALAVAAVGTANAAAIAMAEAMLMQRRMTSPFRGLPDRRPLRGRRLYSFWRRLSTLRAKVELSKGGPSSVSSLHLNHPLEGADAVAFTVLNFETDDYDAWKSMFDSDPAGRKQSGTGHTVSRNADNPNDVFVRVDFASVDDARAFRDRLLASGALDRAGTTLKMGPTVIDPVESVTY